MPRIVKEYDVRRNEILDAAQVLIYTKGYDRMTIQDILDKLQIAKGLFYYYFVSKQAMLMALTERMLETSAQMVEPIVSAPNLTALQKLQQFFSTIIQWETAQKSFILTLLPVWYMDENAIVREQIRKAMTRYDAPLLTTIIHQGISEGVIHSTHPDQAGELILLLFQGLKDAVAQRLLSSETKSVTFEQIEPIAAAYRDAIEGVLRIPSHSLHLLDAESFKEWFGA